MPSKPKVETRTLVYPRGLLDPKGWLNFVQLDPFARAWKRLGLDDDDLRALEIAIMANPTDAPVIRGTGGLRKLRFSPGDWQVGKSGAMRVCYAYFREFGLVALVAAYGKGRKDNLTDQEGNVIRELLREIEEYLARGGSTKRATSGRDEV